MWRTSRRPPSLPRACVIGAGSSGLTALKALRDVGVETVCYELGSRVGGNWVFKNENGLSSAYRSLHINTSRDRMAYADHPMPADYPDFPHHTLIARYFDDYADRFGLRPHIRFGVGVRQVRRGADQTWSVELSDGTTERFDAVLVANGHHWDPRLPDPMPQGAFDGIQLHSHHYIDPDEPHALRGRRVVVVGMGNSAMDIACELSHSGVASRVMLSGRRGAWVIPNYLLGRPLDQLDILGPRVPFPVRRRLLSAVIRLLVGRMEDYGLPAPDHDLGQAHPTISSELLARMGQGDITWHPQIQRLLGDRVRFDDGTEEPADAIIWCTGYRVSFPFFDPQLLSAPDNRLPLFMRVVEPSLPGLYFIGLCQPLGAIMPIAEAQGRWVAAHLTGQANLPTEAQMRDAMAADEAAMARRYIASPRHTMQVDFDDYLATLGKEVARGRRRAARGAGVPGVPARAAVGERPIEAPNQRSKA